MKGLDLSKLKRISKDTFQHADGHTVKIALDKLSPKMREELEKLGAPQKMAEGGTAKSGSSSYRSEDSGTRGVWRYCARCGKEHPNCKCGTAQAMAEGGEPDPTPTSDDSSGSKGPVVINIGSQPNPAPTPTPQPNNMPAAQSVPPAQDLSNVGPQQGLQVEPVDSTDPANQNPSALPAPTPDTPDESQDVGSTMGPNEGPQQPASPAALATPQQVKQHLTAEDKAWAADLSNQHVTPQTYASLFADKSTLGKIGTVFGMLLSGAGSGLSHQPNLLMQTMQKQIDNDLEAQKTSKTNAQNFLKLNQQQQLQTAQIAQMVKQGSLTEAEAKAKLQQIDINSYALAHNQATRAAFHDLVTKYGNTPQGQQALGMMYPMVNDSIINKNDQAAAMSAYLNNMMGQNSNQSDSQGPIDYNRMNQLERNSQAKVPGSPSEADLGEMTKEATKVDENRATRQVFMDSFKRLNDAVLAGTFSPNMRAAEVNALSGQLAHQTVNRYNKAEADNQAEGMFPSATDWGSTREEKLRKAQQFFDAQEAGTPTLDRFHLKNPSPSSSKSQGVSSEGNQQKIKIFMQKNPSVKDPKQAEKILRDNGKL